MSPATINFCYLVASALFIFGLKGLTHPRTAVRGNLLGAAGMLLAVIVTLLDRGIVSFSVRRDAALGNEDHVRIILGPFLDGNSQLQPLSRPKSPGHEPFAVVLGHIANHGVLQRHIEVEFARIGIHAAIEKVNLEPLDFLGRPPLRFQDRRDDPDQELFPTPLAERLPPGQ